MKKMNTSRGHIFFQSGCTSSVLLETGFSGVGEVQSSLKPRTVTFKGKRRHGEPLYRNTCPKMFYFTLFPDPVRGVQLLLGTP